MTVLFWAIISILGVAIIAIFLSLMWWVDTIQEIERDHQLEIHHLRNTVRDLKGAFDCHTKDNKKDMKPLRKAVNQLVDRFEKRDVFQQQFLQSLQERIEAMAEEQQKEFTCTWRVDVAAEDPEAAARQARKLQLDPSALVGNFYVEEAVGTMHWEVDLDLGATAGPYVGATSE